MAAEESRPQRTSQELAEAVLQNYPGRKVDPPPEGLPDGWLCIEKTYQSGTHVGQTYTRFYGGPDFKHKGVLSCRAAILRDAEDRDLDPQEEINKYDRMKQEKAEQRVKSREEAGVFVGEQREQAIAVFRAKFDPLDGPTVQQFQGWTTKFVFLVKCQQVQILHIDPNGKSWNTLKDVECVLGCKMRSGEDIGDFIATARAKANPELYCRQSVLARNNAAAQGTKSLTSMFSNMSKANSETDGGVVSDSVLDDDTGPAPLTATATGESTAAIETADTYGAAEVAAPEPPTTPPQRSASRKGQAGANSAGSSTPAGKRAQVPTTMPGLSESTADPKNAKLAGGDKPAVPTVMSGLSESTADPKKAKVMGGEKLAVFRIDNTALKSPSFGLGYRTSKDFAAKDSDVCAEWGDVIEGVDDGDGWVRIGSRFLPIRVRGYRVLVPLQPGASGDAGEESCAVTDAEAAVASAGRCLAEVALVPASPEPQAERKARKRPTLEVGAAKVERSGRLTGWMLFCRSERPKVIAEGNQQDWIREVARRWRELPAERWEEFAREAELEDGAEQPREEDEAIMSAGGGECGIGDISGDDAVMKTADTAEGLPASDAAGATAGEAKLGCKYNVKRRRRQSIGDEKVPRGEEEQDAQPEEAEEQVEDKLDAEMVETLAAVTPSPVQQAIKRSKPCPTCNAELEWTDYAEGNYAGGVGWECEGTSGCGHNNSNVGSWRWFCRKCENDFCEACFTRVLQSEAPLTATDNNVLKEQGEGSEPDEDVPADSKAHQVLRFCSGYGKYTPSWFFYIKRDKEKMRFQTTISACGGSRETAARIARLCYQKFADGAGKEEVFRFRTEQYRKACDRRKAREAVAQQRSDNTAQASTEVEVSETCEAEKGQPPPIKKRRLRRKKPGSARPTDEQPCIDQGDVPDRKRAPMRKFVPGLLGSRSPVEDAPTDSPAHNKVRFQVSTGSYVFDYYKNEKRMRFQTTFAATNNDKEAAVRIARRCYDAFAKGWERDRILQLRSELYKLHIEWSKKNELQQYVPGSSYRAQKERRRRILAGEPVGPQAQKGGAALGFGARLASRFAEKLVAQRKAEDGTPVIAQKASKYKKKSNTAKLKSLKEKQHTVAKMSSATAATSKQSADDPDAGLPDAPADSLAHSKIIWQEHGKLWWFELDKEDSRIRIQSTVAACGGCRDTAARVARLCYAAAEKGATREDILQLRNEQYRKVAPQAKRYGLSAQNRGGELFRNLHGEVVLVNPSSVCQKVQKKWSELEPSDVDVLTAEDIGLYEKEAKLHQRRTLQERVTRLEQMAQRTTLPQFSQKSSGSSRPSRAQRLEAVAQMADLATREEKKDFGPKFLQAFLALRPEERRLASGLDIAQLERVAQIKDADKFTIAERRTRLKEKLWEARGAVTMGGPGFWKSWMRKPAESEASTAEASGAKASAVPAAIAVTAEVHPAAEATAKVEADAALAARSKAQAAKEAEVADPAAGDSETLAAVTPSPVQQATKRSKPCPSCNDELEWSDYAEGNYAEGAGWECNSASGCGHNISNVGSWRWFCRKCENDFCGACFTRVLQSEAPPIATDRNVLKASAVPAEIAVIAEVHPAAEATAKAEARLEAAAAVAAAPAPAVAANAASAGMEPDTPAAVEAAAVPALMPPATLVSDEAPRVQASSIAAGITGDLEVASETSMIEH